MSHVTRIKTKFTDRAELKAALEDLGYGVWEDVNIPAFERGRQTSQRCDLVIPALPPAPHLVNPAPDEAVREPAPKGQLPLPPRMELIGFQKVGATFQVFADWDELGMTREEFAGIVARRYAYRQVRRKIEAQGFSVTSVEAKDGSTQLLLSRGQEEVQGRIGRDGEVTITARGFEGDACFSATRELEKALGDDIKERVRTVEGLFGRMPAGPVERPVGPVVREPGPTADEFFGPRQAEPVSEREYAEEKPRPEQKRRTRHVSARLEQELRRRR